MPFNTPDIFAFGKLCVPFGELVWKKGLPFPSARSAVPCFPTYSFLPKVETFFIPGKMFVVQTFCLLYLCWQLYSIAPRGGRLGFGCGVSPYLLRSKLLSGGLLRMGDPLG